MSDEIKARAGRVTEQLKAPVRNEENILGALDELGTAMSSAIAELREAGATDTEVAEAIETRTPLRDVPPTVLGVPITTVTGITLDGRNWIEIMGQPRKILAGGGAMLEGRVAQAPGGKAGKFGVTQGDILAVRVSDIKGVQRIAEARSVCGECEAPIGHDHEPHCVFEGQTFFSQTVKAS